MVGNVTQKQKTREVYLGVCFVLLMLKLNKFGVLS